MKEFAEVIRSTIADGFLIQFSQEINFMQVKLTKVYKGKNNEPRVCEYTQMLPLDNHIDRSTTGCILLCKDRINETIKEQLS